MDETDFSDCFDMGEVMYWLQRCMADKPTKTISRYPEPVKTANELMGVVIEWKTWYSKWFAQFEE